MSEGKRRGGRLWSGLLLGAVNGLFGGGGGMIAVPLLGRTLPPKKAHATSVAAVLPAALLSGAVYAFSGRAPLSVLVPAALGVSLGGFLGAKLLPRLPVRAAEFVFGLLMLSAGLGMVL